MSFTFSSEAEENNTGNSLQTADIEIVVSPTDAIITAQNFLGGDSETGVLDVSNSSDIDVLYFVSADWQGSPGTNIRMATILANRLSASVVVSPDLATLFTGKLVDLIDQPTAGRELTTGDPVERLLITLALPEDDATNLVQDISILTDFVFVATQSPA
ncbi:MAG: hypothetical protein Q7J85_03385 [Bacillota bacterium]|nr:hypothetical protein [Bacillota bacterium]